MYSGDEGSTFLPKAGIYREAQAVKSLKTNTDIFVVMRTSGLT
jgi:hypothetical protein